MNSNLAASAFVVALLVASGAQTARASTFVGGTVAWTFVGSPIVEKLGFSHAVAVTFENHLDVPVLGIVIMVLHNELGQTVYYSTATVNIARGFYGTAYVVEVGLPPGTYSATVFAFSASGVAISNSTTLTFQTP